VPEYSEKDNSMNYSEAEYGRVFIIRLEDGDIVHKEIEKFAGQKGISSAALIILGGADKNSRLIVGPEKARSISIKPMNILLDNVNEVTGTGTIFPDKNNKPVLHMHIASGRKKTTITGCVRSGVKVWHVMEVILFELISSSATRKLDTETGFELLEP
jgi:predicted DNA-binding protein with PD1-like motif